MTASQKNNEAEGSVTIHTPSRYSYLRMIRQAVTDLARRSGLTDFKASQLEMAVDEACTNIIEHSYGGEAGSLESPAHPGLRVNLMNGGDRIVVEIVDRGAGFDFNGQPGVTPDAYLDEGRNRGLGMYIIRRFVDDITYERGTPAGNVLRLTKLI